VKVVSSRIEISVFHSLFFHSKKCQDLVAADSEITMKYIREIMVGRVLIQRLL